MKYTVFGTRYTTIHEGAEVEVEADDERQAAEKAQELAYVRKLKWEKDGAFAPTYKWELGEDGDHVFSVDDLGEMRKGI
jgi:hypothetical protein